MPCLSRKLLIFLGCFSQSITIPLASIGEGFSELTKSVKEVKKIKNKKKSIKRKSNEISADEVKQKIDLAVAYIEMGEKKNARTTINQLKKFNLSAVEKKLIKDLNKNL